MADQATKTPAQDKKINLSPDQAVQVIQPAAAAVRQTWLTAAITLANAIRGGKPVTPGAFEDVKRLREQYEELERARVTLLGINAAVQKAGAKPDA